MRTLTVVKLKKFVVSAALRKPSVLAAICQRTREATSSTDRMRQTTALAAASWTWTDAAMIRDAFVRSALPGQGMVNRAG